MSSTDKMSSDSTSHSGSTPNINTADDKITTGPSSSSPHTPESYFEECRERSFSEINELPMGCHSSGATADDSLQDISSSIFMPRNNLKNVCGNLLQQFEGPATNIPLCVGPEHSSSPPSSSVNITNICNPSTANICQEPELRKSIRVNECRSDYELSKTKSNYPYFESCTCKICSRCDHLIDVKHVPKKQDWVGTPCGDVRPCFDSTSSLEPFPFCIEWECLNDDQLIDRNIRNSTLSQRRSLLISSEYREMTADLHVKIKGEVFKCHRFLLARCSKYFYEILKKHQNEQIFLEIELHDVEPQAFSVIHNWMYSCELHNDPNQLIEILHTAQYLDIPEVVVSCMEVLDKQIEDPDRLLITYDQAIVCGKRCLSNHILQLMGSDFLNIVTNSSFLNLDAEAVVSLLSYDNLNVESEIDVFQAALRWLCFDLEARRRDAAEILLTIRFAHMTEEELFECLYCEASESVMCIPECRLLVLQGYLYHTSKAMGTIDQYPQLNIPKRCPLWQPSPKIEEIVENKNVTFQSCSSSSASSSTADTVKNSYTIPACVDHTLPVCSDSFHFQQKGFCNDFHDSFSLCRGADIVPTFVAHSLVRDCESPSADLSIKISQPVRVCDDSKIMVCNDSKTVPTGYDRLTFPSFQASHLVRVPTVPICDDSHPFPVCERLPRVSLCNDYVTRISDGFFTNSAHSGSLVSVCKDYDFEQSYTVPPFEDSYAVDVCEESSSPPIYQISHMKIPRDTDFIKISEDSNVPIFKEGPVCQDSWNAAVRTDSKYVPVCDEVKQPISICKDVNPVPVDSQPVLVCKSPYHSKISEQSEFVPIYTNSHSVPLTKDSGTAPLYRDSYAIFVCKDSNSLQICKETYSISKDEQPNNIPISKDYYSIPLQVVCEIPEVDMLSQNRLTSCQCPILCFCRKNCSCRKICSCTQSCLCPKVCSCAQKCYCPKFCTCSRLCACPKFCSCPKTCQCSTPCLCNSICSCPKICSCWSKEGRPINDGSSSLANALGAIVPPCSPKDEDKRKFICGPYFMKNEEEIQPICPSYIKLERIFLLGGFNPLESWSSDFVGRMMYVYNPSNNEWKKYEELPDACVHSAATALKGKIYLSGGCSPVHASECCKIIARSACWCYVLQNLRWCQLQDMGHKRIHHVMEACEEHVYVIGGQNECGDLLCSVECYSVEEDSWKEVSPLKYPRMGMASTIHKNCIWVCGGLGWKEAEICPTIVDIAEYYSPSTNSWCQVHCLRFPRCFANLVDYNETLYLIGGVTKVTSKKDGVVSSVASVDIYEDCEDEWYLQAALQMPRQSAAAAVVNDQLYVIGGVTSIESSALDCVECYDGRWGWVRGRANLPRPLSGMASVVACEPNIYDF